MKKIISLLLAMIMVFSLATVAFADGDALIETEDWVSAEKTEAIKLKKVYTVSEASTNEDLFPAEVLTFAVNVPNGVQNPSNTMITVDELTVVGNTNQEIVVNLPVYNTVGIYEYVITENAGDTQGVTYTEAAINLKVLVEYDYTAKCLKSSIVLNTTAEAGGKVDTFTNEYDVGTLTVKKTISGNLASSEEYFEIDVTLTATKDILSDITVSGGSDKSNEVTIEPGDWNNGSVTTTIKLRANETVTFDNIPAGVTYAVAEKAKHIKEGDEFLPNDPTTDYTVTYTSASGDITKDATDAAVVNNEKSTSIQTGISLDSAPYFVILAVAMFGMVALVSKKRYEV